MELYQLRAFVAVAEEGNVTRAAERLFSSQPAVSGQIKTLEQLFGLALFMRTPGGMVLTEAGRRLLAEAREALQRAQRVEDLARHLRDGNAGTLRVGLNTPAERIQIEAITRRLMADNAELRLHVSSGRSGEIVRGLSTYDLDVGFVEGPIEPRMQGYQIGEAEICVMTPTAWADELDSDDLRVLESRPWIFTSPDCSYYRLSQQLVAEHGLKLEQRFQVDEDGMTVQFVRSGLAISLADRVTAEAAAAEGGVHVWPHFSARLPVHLVALKRRADEPAIAAFFEACRAVYGATVQRRRVVLGEAKASNGDGAIGIPGGGRLG